MIPSLTLYCDISAVINTFSRSKSELLSTYSVKTSCFSCPLLLCQVILGSSAILKAPLLNNIYCKKGGVYHSLYTHQPPWLSTVCEKSPLEKQQTTFLKNQVHFDNVVKNGENGSRLYKNVIKWFTAVPASKLHWINKAST